VSDEPPIRIFLSPPDVGPGERELLLDAFDSNWIAPLGPHVDAFERELASYLGASYAVALSSGTAALHLALLLHGVGPGDRVLCPTMTFVATANAIRYVGAEPVFVDCDGSWNLDPTLVEAELARAAATGEAYAAVVAVDLYGRCCDYGALEPLAARYGIPLIEDAAESLGARYASRAAGTFGDVGVFSFNGNKIITTSGGGMLVTEDADIATRARHLATQAREPAPHYEHVELGFNYRLSNLLAAVGRAQLAALDDKVTRRRRIAARYRESLAGLPGVHLGPGADTTHEPNAWLTCLTIDPEQAGVDREAVRRDLRSVGIEARPLWKPMHLQPVFVEHRVVGGVVAAGVFARGLCLPSGSSLSEGEQDEICARIHELVRVSRGSATPADSGTWPRSRSW
jgi:dTDP-4-amino-4,6-dideoxygalactose transaminase